MDSSSLTGVWVFSVAIYGVVCLVVVSFPYLLVVAFIVACCLQCLVDCCGLVVG